jgi:hypothetical protein
MSVETTTPDGEQLTEVTREEIVERAADVLEAQHPAILQTHTSLSSGVVAVIGSNDEYMSGLLLATVDNRDISNLGFDVSYYAEPLASDPDGTVFRILYTVDYEEFLDENEVLI